MTVEQLETSLVYLQTIQTVFTLFAPSHSPSALQLANAQTYRLSPQPVPRLDLQLQRSTTPDKEWGW